MKIEEQSNGINIVEFDTLMLHVQDPEKDYISFKQDVVSEKILTDGVIISVGTSDSIPIYKSHITKIKYDHRVDEVIMKRVYIKDASYIVSIAYSWEKIRIGTGGIGWKYIPNSTEIFLIDKKNKIAKRRAKETIRKQLCNYTSEISSLNRNYEHEVLVYDQVKPNIYQLKK